MWRLRVYLGRDAKGQPIQRSKTLRAPGAAPKAGAGSRLADRELAKMVAEVAAGNTATGAQTFGELLDRLLEHAEAIGRSPTTIREHRHLVEKIIKPELGKLRLAKLSAVDLDRLCRALTKRGLKPASVRRVNAVIGAARHQGKKWGLVDRDASRDATPPSPHAAEVTTPDPEQVRAIVSAAEEIEPALATLLLMAAQTGARRGELCALRRSDFDEQARTLTIARSVHEIAGGGWAEKDTKTRAKRRVGLDDLAMEILRRHRAAIESLARDLGVTVVADAFVFSRSPAGTEPIRPDVVSKFTRRAAQKAGVDTHLHVLRHSLATQYRCRVRPGNRRQAARTQGPARDARRL